MGRPLQMFDTEVLAAELEYRGFDPDYMADGRDIERLAELIAEGNTIEALRKLRETFPVAALSTPETIIRQTARISGKPMEAAHVHR